MFEGLAAAIEGVEVPVEGASIAEARRLLDRLEAKIVEAESAFMATGQFQVEGFADMATFERHACRVSLPQSRRLARRAGRLSAWPELAEAWRSGRVTGAQVEVLCQVVPNRHVERFAESMDQTVELLGALSARHTGVVVRRAVATAEAFAEREAAEAGIESVEKAPVRELTAARSLDDEMFLNGHIDCDSAAIVEKALVAATTDDAEGERRTPAERRADALVAVCQGYLDSLANPDGNRRTERLTLTADVTVLYRAWLRGAGVVTADDLDRFLDQRPGLGDLDRGLFADAFDGTSAVRSAATVDGHAVTDSLVSAVASGGAMELLLSAGPRLLRLGRSVRGFTPAQRRAVLARDGGCRSCGAPAERCDIHHVTPWEHGGSTDVDNAVAKCGRCHRHHHRLGWVDKLDTDGTYRVTRPDGTEIATRPAGLDDQLPLLPVATTSEPARTPRFTRPSETEPSPAPASKPPEPLGQDSIEPGRTDADAKSELAQTDADAETDLRAGRAGRDSWDDPTIRRLSRELVMRRFHHGDGDPTTIALREQLCDLLDAWDAAA